MGTSTQTWWGAHFFAPVAGRGGASLPTRPDACLASWYGKTVLQQFHCILTVLMPVHVYGLYKDICLGLHLEGLVCFSLRYCWLQDGGSLVAKM